MATVSNAVMSTVASSQKSTASGKKEKNQNIQVVVRCRPLNSSEKKNGAHSIVDVCPERKEISIKERALLSAPVKSFTYDRVFPGSSKQIEIYKTVVVPILEEVLMGYNCTVFAYGQTGTGKTFTMEGERSEDTSISWEEDPLSGIIPRAMNQLFTRLQKQECEFTVRVSYLEIYNEELIDLLGAESVENPRLKIYEDNVKKGACIIQGLEEVVVNSRDQVYQILQQGTARRQTASTLMNAHSSRSHTLFMVTVHIKESSVDGEELLKTGKLNLVDLAGSECVGRSGAVDKRAREAGNINQSLLTLGRVISALVEHTPHVPYRESKLTRLLQDSLGGRTKTSIIATISPASSNLDETLSTLDYAFRARNITNKPEINQKLTKKALLKEYTEEIERMRRDLQAARDKNGIFLAEENYVAIQTQIAQQQDAIKDLEEKICTANLEMIKLNDMFTDTKQELEVTTKELQQTGEQLEMTTSTLKVTERKLDRTTFEREEQRHLVAVHVKTEDKLHSQASKLLSTADVSTSDVSGLHDKLDRRRRVDNINESVQQRFHGNYHNSIDELDEELSNFMQKQHEFSKGLCDDINALLAKKAAEVEKMSSSLDSITGFVNQGLESIHSTQEQHVNSLREWFDQQSEQSCVTRDAEVCRAFDFNESVVTSSVMNINAGMKQLVDDMTQLRQTFAAKLGEHETFIGQFVNQQQLKIQEHRQVIDLFVSEQADWLAEHRQVSEDFYHQQKTANENRLQKVMEAIGSAMKTMVAEQESDLASQTQAIVRGFETRKTKTEDFKVVSDRALTSVVEQSETDKNNLLSSLANHCSESQQTLDDFSQTVKVSNRQMKQFGIQVSEFCTTTQDVWQTTTNEHVESIQCRRQATDESLNQHHIDTQELCCKNKAAVKAIDAAQTVDHDHLKADLQNQYQSINENAYQVHAWTQHVDSLLQQNRSAVDDFLTKDLQKDVPTGKTPQRRDFEYPRRLTRTAPHTKIMEEFRKIYLEQEALHKQLPGDSDDEDDKDEIRTVSMRLDIDDQTDSTNNEQLETVDDPLNLSGDSAISSNSAMSFEHVNDQIIVQDKENKIKKPSGVPLRSRHGISKSLTSDNHKDRILKPTSKPSSAKSTPLKSSNSVNEKL